MRDKLYSDFDRSVIEAVKLQTEANLVIKTMYNSMGGDALGGLEIEDLTNDELQKLGLDVDSEIIGLLAIHKQYVLRLPHAHDFTIPIPNDEFDIMGCSKDGCHVQLAKERV